VLPRVDGMVDLGALLATLHERELLRLLLEGGATLAGSFVRQRLVDVVAGYHAPALLGAGPPVLATPASPPSPVLCGCRSTRSRAIGEDVRVTCVASIGR